MQTRGAAMTEVLRVKRLELAFVSRRWQFAEDRRAEIACHFALRRCEKPAMWNGPVLLLTEPAITAEVFRGAYFETDYASFIAWRDWGFPDPTVKNCFALGALLARDGGFLLGVMGPHTLNAGEIYFPAGTPDPNDIVGDTVDLAGSIRREIAEETGLDPGLYEAEEGWYCVPHGALIAQIMVLRVDETAVALRQRILSYLAREAEPELADVRIVHGIADLDPTMPPFVTAFLRHVWNLRPEIAQ